ncbi:MAG: CsbD family protein [Potamolinea sp.]
MSLENQAKNIVGKAQEALGKATGNQDMQAEGMANQIEAQVSQKVEDAKNKASKAIDNLADKAKKIIE